MSTGHKSNIDRSSPAILIYLNTLFELLRDQTRKHSLIKGQSAQPLMIGRVLLLRSNLICINYAMIASFCEVQVAKMDVCTRAVRITDLKKIILRQVYKNVVNLQKGLKHKWFGT